MENQEKINPADHLGLARQIGHRWATRSPGHREDLIAAATEGLVIAAQRFDPARGTHFSTYATHYCVAWVRKYLKDQAFPVRIKSGADRLYFKIARARAMLSAKGLDATPDRVAQLIRADVGKVASIMGIMALPVALDAPRGEDSPGGMDLEAPAREGPDESDLDLVRAAMTDFRQTLSDIETAIWDSRIATSDPATGSDVGLTQGVTKQRVCQIEAELKARFVRFARKRIK